MATTPRVAYFYDSEVGNYYYGQGHPMKPHRIRMTHNLLLNYGVYKQLEIFRPHSATEDEITKFHADDYAEFLRVITPDNMNLYTKQLQMFNVGDDTPVFDGIWDYCRTSAGGSIDGAVRIARNECEIAINWAGGLHHAKKSEASGFCYVNDIVLAILELLKTYQRVLYVDIDIHHGDGVEEAFYTTDRVMTLSLHKFGDFFPGTGDVEDVGYGPGKNYALNFPLNDGVDDETFASIFKPLMDRIMGTFAPEVIVLQCGADSLTGDRLGCFNLSMRGHAFALEHCKTFGVPILMLGGGGYTIRNVARCWTYETARCVNVELSDQVPFSEFIEYYGPDYKLHIETNNMENLNSQEYIDKHLTKLLERLRHVTRSGAAPGARPAAMQVGGDPNAAKDNADPDKREDVSDKRVKANELDASGDEGDGNRNRSGGDFEESKAPAIERLDPAGDAAAAEAVARDGVRTPELTFVRDEKPQVDVGGAAVPAADVNQEAQDAASRAAADV